MGRLDVRHTPDLRLKCVEHPNDGLGLKSGLIWGQSITVECFREIALKPRGDQSDSPMSTDRIYAPGNGSPAPLYKPASAVTSVGHPMRNA
jgi:hypothetical protein